MKLQRLVLGAVLALAGCSNVNPTVATESASGITRHILTDARGEAATNAGSICRNRFEECVDRFIKKQHLPPEAASSACIPDRTNCMADKTIELNIGYQPLNLN